MNRCILLSSLALSVIFESLLWGVRSGPGWLILVVLAAGLSDWLRRRLERPFNAWIAWLWLGAGALAAAPLLYDAQTVHTLAPPLCLLTLILAIHHTVSQPQSLELLTETAFCSWKSSREAYRLGASACPTLPPSTRKGLGMAVPLLLLFGLLFLQADPAFEAFLLGGFEHGPGHLGRALRCVLWTWLTAGLLLQAQWHTPGQPHSGGNGDGASWGVALHATNLLFILFLVCQSRYLFAGRAPQGLNLAEYARHGFFELFVATLLVVGLVTIVHGAVFLSDPSTPARAACLLMLVLTFGLVASSALRMHLYVEHFGLTLTRAYVLATLVGIVATLLLCLAALAFWLPPAWLRARLVLLGLFSLAGVGLTNVEAWVARVNLARPEVDYAYLSTLSCDILPALDLNQPAQRQLLVQLRQRHPEIDWRAWNLSLQNVHNSVTDR